jgi:hypothetical protein
MAHIEGTQEIPSEMRKLYQATLGLPLPDGQVKKRVPFRNKKMQAFGSGVTEKQNQQRDRFLNAIDKFNNADDDTRSRWYDAEPEYNSFLWYYNYFILSGLNGNANGQQGGYGVIKLIQHISTSLATGGATISIPTAIDPQKAVVMAWGAAYNYYEVALEPGGYGWAWNCFPVPKILNSSSLEAVWSNTPQGAGNCSFIVIEYI